jgi:hypothetical protein
MSRPGNHAAEHSRADRATSQRIGELLQESRLRTQQPRAWQVGVEGESLPDCLAVACHHLQTLGRYTPSSTNGASYLKEARSTGRKISGLIRWDWDWLRNRSARGTRLYCLRMADYMATAGDPAEADQFASLLRQAIRRHSRDVPVGDQDSTTRLDKARTVGRQVADIIGETHRGRRLQWRMSWPVRECRRIARYLADAQTEAEAEQWTTLLEKTFERYQAGLASAAVPYPHLSTVYDTSSRLADAQSVGRQIAGLLRRTDLGWQSTACPGAAATDLLTMAGQLAGAQNEADAERFATMLGQAIRNHLPDLAGRPALHSDLHAMAIQTERIAFGFVSAGRQWHGGRQLNSALELPPIVKRTTHMYICPPRVPAKELVRRWVQAGNDPGRAGRCALRFAVAVLPAPAQARYAEEWADDLWSLRGSSRLRRATHAVRLAIRAPLVRHNLRAYGTEFWTSALREPR